MKNLNYFQKHQLSKSACKTITGGNTEGDTTGGTTDPTNSTDPIDPILTDPIEIIEPLLYGTRPRSTSTPAT